MASVTRKIRTIVHNPRHVPSLVWRRVSTRLSHTLCHLLDGYAAPPETVNIYPTDRCNLKCSMCFEKSRKPHPEIPLDDWIKIIEQIKKFHPRIHLSGGEPFLYPEIKGLISYLKKHDLFVAITTNGTFLLEYATDIIGMKINELHVSIDGPKEIHDSIRGVAGTYDRIIHGLGTIKGLKTSGILPLIRINSMINFATPDVMKKMIKVACDIDAESIQFLHPLFVDAQSLAIHRRFLGEHLNRDLNYWQFADIVCGKPNNFTTAYNLLEDIYKEQALSVEIFPRFGLEQMKAYYTMDSRFYSAYYGRCHAMWNTATILASGEVESCPDYVLGNCIAEDFASLWNNEKMRQLRRRIRNRKFFTVCRACCYFYQR